MYQYMTINTIELGCIGYSNSCRKNIFTKLTTIYALENTNVYLLIKYLTMR